MSLIKKSDVKNHLSSRRHTNLLSFMQANQPIPADRSGSQRSEVNRDSPAARLKSGLGFYAVTPIAPAKDIDSGNTTDEPAVKKPLA